MIFKIRSFPMLLLSFLVGCQLAPLDNGDKAVQRFPNSGPGTGAQVLTSSEIVFDPAGPNAYHQLGRRSDSGGWEVDMNTQAQRFLTYGPYTTVVAAGASVARFSLALDNVNADNERILTLDVFDATQQKVLTAKTLRRTDFQTPFQPQDFDVSFFQTAGHTLEFRVFWTGHSYVRHANTKVYAEAPADFATDPMGAFWQGRAQFRYVKTLNWALNESSGSVVVKNGAWYVFNREAWYTATPSYCKNLYFARTVARASYDQGATWSDKQVVAEPNPSNKDMNCSILDGHAYFDDATSTWHLLSQCLGSGNAWQLCHFTRQDPSPVGPFVADPQNPTVKAGQLWKPICGGNYKSCPPTTVDEGTPEILYKYNGYFYVTFHGFDPGPSKGYRSVARTTDFKNWEVVGAGLPGDAMFGPADCQLWNTNCIGGGEATTLASGGYYYMLMETPNLSLTCQVNQVWNFGLVRSPSLSRSGLWDSYGQNPLLKPSSNKGCDLQYARLFYDRGSVFLIYEDLMKGRRLFKLAPGSGAPLVE